MDKNTTLGAILCILSNWEKGRIPTHRFWRKKYINSLINSVNMMNYIISLLKTPGDLSYKYTIRVAEFIMENNKIFVPNKERMEIWKCDNYFLSNYDSDVDVRILNLFEKSVVEISQLLSSKIISIDIGAHKRIGQLLRAIHNLPRAYLDSSIETVVEQLSSQIPSSTAINYYMNYM